MYPHFIIQYTMTKRKSEFTTEKIEKYYDGIWETQDGPLSRILEFVNGSESYIYTGVLCKSLNKGVSRKTSYSQVSKSIDRLNEFHNTIGMNSNILNVITKSSSFTGEIESLRNIKEWSSLNDIRMGGSRSSGVMENACLSQNISVMQWCKDYGYYNPSDKIMFVGVSTGNISVASWLVKNGCKRDSFSSGEPAARGDIRMLKYLYKGREWDNRLLKYAARNGHLDVIKYAMKKKCGKCPHAPGMAALGGHLDILKYFDENGFEKNRDVSYLAAMYGHLDVIKWAHENQYPWDGWTIKLARKKNHHNVVQYALHNGCPA